MKRSRIEDLKALVSGDATALGQTREDVERARALLASDDPKGLDTLPELLIELVLAHAADQGRDAFLAQATTGPKKIAKLAKKELYRLQSQGRAVELPRAPEPERAIEAEPSALPCFLSHVDIDGRRNFVAARLDAHGHLEAFTGELSDVEGLVRIERLELARRDYRRFAREEQRHEGGAIPMMELSPRRLGGIFAAHRAINAQRATEPAGLGALLRAFPGTLEDARTEAEQRPPLPDAEERERVREGAALFTELVMAGWMPSNEALMTLGQKLDEVMASKLNIDEQQRRTRFDHALNATVEGFFTSEERLRHARRLFEMADFFEAVGEPHPAALAEASARALRSDRAIQEIPFARVLFEKALVEQTRSAMAQLGEPEPEAPPKTPPSGLIVPP